MGEIRYVMHFIYKMFANLDVLTLDLLPLSLPDNTIIDACTFSSTQRCRRQCPVASMGVSVGATRDGCQGLGHGLDYICKIFTSLAGLTSDLSPPAPPGSTSTSADA